MSTTHTEDLDLNALDEKLHAFISAVDATLATMSKEEGDTFTHGLNTLLNSMVESQRVISTLRRPADQAVVRNLLQQTPLNEWLSTARMVVEYDRWRRRERLNPRRHGRSRIQRQGSLPTPRKHR